MSRSQLIILAFWVFACVEPYQPSVIEETDSILVVEAFLDKSGKATASLSYTRSINGADSPGFENWASVEIRDDEENRFSLTFTEAGKYVADNIAVDEHRRYRLHITTLSGKVYLSELVAVNTTPAIESISYAVDEFGLNLYVNSYDGSQSSGYYKWNFIETWQYFASYRSRHKAVDGDLVERTPDEYTDICYQSLRSQRVLVGTTKQFTADRVSNYLVQTIPHRSVKLSYRYSIEVSQYSITKEAYDYWLSLKSSSEQVGGLFDPLPTQVAGNIRCLSDSNEKVIGFFSASSVSTLRIFVTPDEAGKAFQRFLYPICGFDTILFSDNSKITSPDVVGPYFGNPDSPAPTGFLMTDRACIDCRVAGGSFDKPEFWD